MASTILEDVGYLSLTIRSVPDEDGKITEVTQSLDLWKTCNHLHQMQRDMEGKPVVEFHAAVVQFLSELGFPACSHKLADDFVGAIRRAVDQAAQKKSGNTTESAGSPASTEASTSVA